MLPCPFGVRAQIAMAGEVELSLLTSVHGHILVRSPHCLINRPHPPAQLSLLWRSSFGSLKQRKLEPAAHMPTEPHLRALDSFTPSFPTCTLPCLSAPAPAKSPPPLPLQRP